MLQLVGFAVYLDLDGLTCDVNGVTCKWGHTLDVVIGDHLAVQCLLIWTSPIAYEERPDTENIVA